MNRRVSAIGAVPRGIAALACFLILGCAAEVTRHSVAFSSLETASGVEQRLVRKNELVKFNSGYERVIAKDSPWKLVGSVSQGKVYASAASVFSVEGAHVHEAYLVVARGNLVGFYLPVERAFSPLDPVRVVNLWEE